MNVLNIHIIFLVGVWLGARFKYVHGQTMGSGRGGECVSNQVAGLQALSF